MNYNSHPKMKYLYIGVDCHKFTHTATFINCFNEKITTITFNNDKNGFEYLIQKVEEYKSDLIPIYGLEDVKHLGYELASYLLSKNKIVKHVNSNLTYVERKKNAVVTKNDEEDSKSVAKVLLDELDDLPTVQSDEVYWTLKQLVKMRTSIVKNNTHLKNKLHAQLMHHYPNYNEIFYDVACKTALTFWENYPNPQLIKEEDFDIFVSNLKTWSKSNCGEKKAKEILEIIDKCDNAYQEYQKERGTIIKVLVKQLKNNLQRIEELEKEIIDIYDKLNCKLHTFPCLTKISGACLLSEIGNVGRFKDKNKLAKYAGIAPIEKSSGGIEKEITNNYGNRDLHSVFFGLACRTINTGSRGDTPYNPIFQEYYQKKLNQGKTKHQAIICVMRRLCNIIYVILKNETEYQNPEELAEQCKISFRERKKLEEEKQKLKNLLIKINSF